MSHLKLLEGWANPQKLQWRTKRGTDITAEEMAAGGPAAKWMLMYARLSTQAGSWQEGGKVRELALPLLVSPLRSGARPGAAAAPSPWAEFAEQSTSGCSLLGIGGVGG